MKDIAGLRTICSALIWLAISALTPVAAEQKQDFGPYEVHYIALPTTVLQPEIAKQFGLVRSKTTGFLNVSVIKNLPDGTKKSVTAFIRGSIRNLLQQQRALEFSRVSEGQSIYQIANFWYSQGELMTFKLEIQADPQLAPFSMKFNQALYPD
jgi:hypothetical protein